jgi:hypothetical protein
MSNKPITVEDVQKQALKVLYGELERQNPKETYILTSGNERYRFDKYPTGWVLHSNNNLRPLLENLTDEQMFAHVKLLRG